MKITRNLFLLLSVFTLSLMAHEEGQLGMIKGDNLGLYYTDHAISGHVKGQLVYATPFENEFGIKLTHRTQGQDFLSDFKKVGEILTGKIQSLNAKGEKSETEVKITRVNGKEGIIEGLIGATAFKVHVTSKTMAGNHFVNPEFDVTLPGGNYKFALENGMACMGCATKIVYVVLGMLRNTEVL